MIASSGSAKSVDHDRADAQALDLAKQAIALRSVRGPGNQVPQVAALFKSALVAGGFSDADVTITPVDDTAFLIARWKGRDPKLKPLVISGHMDVVEAKASDWERDPFTPVVENGLLYGRGSSDMKLDDALAVAALIELKREGYQPRRDLVLALSGDEETTMKTTQMLAKELSNAEMVLNVDGTGGQLDSQGKPQYFTWSGAEKTYADFELTVTSPGGHSSRPYEPNAINQLSAALVRIGQYKFKPELSELTRAYFKAAADYESSRDSGGNARVRGGSDRCEGHRHVTGESRDRRQDRHDLRRDNDQRRPCAQRAATAGHCKHQLPDLPRPSACRDHGGTAACRSRHSSSVQGCLHGQRCNRRFAHSPGCGCRGHEGHPHRLSGDSRIPDNVSRRERQHVVSQ